MSLASGIKLAPIRMGDLVATAAASGTAAAPKPKEGYIAPHLRNGVAEAPTQAQPKMDTTNFPTLGTPPSSAKAVVWQKSPTSPSPNPASPTSPTPTSPSFANFKATVDACIEKERQTEAERAKMPETDVLKMSTEEREADGWTALSMSRTSILGILRKEHIDEPELLGTFTFAEMAALRETYEKRVDKEIDFYRDRPSSRSFVLKKTACPMDQAMRSAKTLS